MVPQQQPLEPPAEALCHSSVCSHYPPHYPFPRHLYGITILFLCRFHVFTSLPSVFFRCGVSSKSLSNKSCHSSVSFFSAFFSSPLIYGGWRDAGVESYDVWPQRLFLSALIWQSYCCPRPGCQSFLLFLLPKVAERLWECPDSLPSRPIILVKCICHWCVSVCFCCQLPMYCPCLWISWHDGVMFF